MKIGYARVSMNGQSDDSQVDDLTAHGVDRLFVDRGVSGRHASRPELDAALSHLRAGDQFVITRMSRAMRSLKDMIALSEDLRKREVDLVVLKQNIDTSTRTGPGKTHSSPAGTGSAPSPRPADQRQLSHRYERRRIPATWKPVPTRAHRAVPPTDRRNRNGHEAQKPAPVRTVTKPGEPDSLRLHPMPR